MAIRLTRRRKLFITGASISGIIYANQPHKYTLLSFKKGDEDDDENDDWSKAAYRYFSELIENPNLPNKLKDLKAPSGESVSFSSNVSEFKKSCSLPINDKPKTTWCVEFTSISDKLKDWENKELNDDTEDSNWSGKYALNSISDSASEFLKNLKTSQKNNDKEAAFQWCLLFSDREYDYYKYQDFKNRCVIRDIVADE